MTITARYPGRCATCGGRITPGQQIEWTKGGASRHTACVASGTRRSTPARAQRPATGRAYGRRRAGVAYSSAPAVSRRLRAPKEGEQIIHRDRAPYEPGQTIHATRVPGGGGPDGHYWTVVAAGAHRISQAENDCREGETRYDAIVRPATDDEAAACAARIAEADARQARIADLTHALRTSRVRGETDARLMRLPEGVTVLWEDARLAGSEAWYQAPDGSVWYARSSYDDGPAVWRTTATPEQVLEAKSLGLKAGLL